MIRIYLFLNNLVVPMYVCRDNGSMHKGPVRFASMKMKHNDNKNGEEINIY